VAENSNEIRVSGSDFIYLFSKQSGALKSIQKSGTEYLDGEPELKVWRPPLANDTDPWGSQYFNDRNFTPGFGRSIDNQLRTLGLKNLETQLDEIEVRQLPSKVVILVKQISNSSLPANRKMNTWANASAFEQNNIWTIYPDGTMELEQEIIPHGPMPKMMQKVGLQFQLQKAFNRVEWYGRGPFENYPDRKTGAKVGRYKSDVDEMYVPYIISQEYGNRSDTRWIKVSNNAGRGLYVKSEDEFNFSLHKYSDENLERAYYTYQLKESATTILNVDYEVTGVGGTANRQLQKYRVLPDVKKYKITIKPF
jgi:beta-galactosidase